MFDVSMLLKLQEEPRENMMEEMAARWMGVNGGGFHVRGGENVDYEMYETARDVNERLVVQKGTTKTIITGTVFRQGLQLNDCTDVVIVGCCFIGCGITIYGGTKVDINKCAFYNFQDPTRCSQLACAAVSVISERLVPRNGVIELNANTSYMESIAKHYDDLPNVTVTSCDINTLLATSLLHEQHILRGAEDIAGRCCFFVTRGACSLTVCKTKVVGTIGSTSLDTLLKISDCQFEADPAVLAIAVAAAEQTNMAADDNSACDDRFKKVLTRSASLGGGALFQECVFAAGTSIIVPGASAVDTLRGGVGGSIIDFNDCLFQFSAHPLLCIQDPPINVLTRNCLVTFGGEMTVLLMPQNRSCYPGVPSELTTGTTTSAGTAAVMAKSRCLTLLCGGSGNPCTFFASSKVVFAFQGSVTAAEATAAELQGDDQRVMIARQLQVTRDTVTGVMNGLRLCQQHRLTAKASGAPPVPLAFVGISPDCTGFIVTRVLSRDYAFPPAAGWAKEFVQLNNMAPSSGLIETLTQRTTQIQAAHMHDFANGFKLRKAVQTGMSILLDNRFDVLIIGGAAASQRIIWFPEVDSVSISAKNEDDERKPVVRFIGRGTVFMGGVPAVVTVTGVSFKQLSDFSMSDVIVEADKSAVWDPNVLLTAAQRTSFQQSAFNVFCMKGGGIVELKKCTVSMDIATCSMHEGMSVVLYADKTVVDTCKFEMIVSMAIANPLYTALFKEMMEGPKGTICEASLGSVVLVKGVCEGVVAGQSTVRGGAKLWR